MLTCDETSFRLHGKKFHIYSGAMHYFRILPQYWEDRLQKLKAAGFNTVETYVCWNLHEPQKGQFDFSGRLDLVRFLETAQKVGLYALVRPAPTSGAEWDFGGLPAWLLRERDLRAAVQRSPLFGPRSRLFPGAAAKAPAFAMQPGRESLGAAGGK